MTKNVQRWAVDTKSTFSDKIQDIIKAKARKFVYNVEQKWQAKKRLLAAITKDDASFKRKQKWYKENNLE